jgi:hypothetical protein
MSSSNANKAIYALINYEDPYVQTLILSALEKHLPPSSYHLITSLTELSSPTSLLLQWVQYESISFDHLTSHPNTSFANAYIIRKALIRKHYLSTTIANWITKYPNSPLKQHVKPSVAFEVDYAEFLDDALVEAWDLKESWARNEGKEGNEREWWILKPGMSERGQGIRLFSSEEELTEIFEEWDPESDDEDDADARSDRNEDEGDGIMTSQLRHFIAQPYIHPPLLFIPPSLASTSPELRKFHIRTYVLATSALQVYVYRDMLALFAAKPYAPPWEYADLSAHLTNTCLQETGEREGSVGRFWDLPDTLLDSSTTSSSETDKEPWKDVVFKHICDTTSETYLAAARSMSIHFQPLPNAFEIFGLDFMCSIDQQTGGVRTWLLEVNAFPDFRQTGEECKGVVEGLFEGVVGVVVGGMMGVDGMKLEGEEKETSGMVKVLDVDLGRR